MRTTHLQLNQSERMNAVLNELVGNFVSKNVNLKISGLTGHQKSGAHGPYLPLSLQNTSIHVVFQIFGLLVVCIILEIKIEPNVQTCRSFGAPIPKMLAHTRSRTLCSCMMCINPLVDYVLTCKQHTGSIRGHNHLMDEMIHTNHMISRPHLRLPPLPHLLLSETLPR